MACIMLASICKKNISSSKQALEKDSVEKEIWDDGMCSDTTQKAADLHQKFYVIETLYRYMPPEAPMRISEWIHFLS